ncbi:MAG TPA: hypothetical protein VIM99_12770 [Blastocatellia bacterium]
MSLASFDAFYLGYGREASRAERLIMAALFCVMLYGVTASFIGDLRRSGLSRFQIAQTSVSLMVFGFIILLNAVIGYKIANHIPLASWENAYVDWLNAVFFLLTIALRVAVPFSLIFPRRPEPNETEP